MTQFFIKTLISLVCLSTLYAHGQGFQVNFQGQKQQGMGLAGTALYQDASTLFFNPGAVAFAKENSINVGMTPIFGNVLFVDSLTQNGYRTENPVGRPFYAYGLYQLKDSSNLKLGMAIYTPFGSTVQWEDSWIGRFALSRLSLAAVYIQPTVSYRINDKIGVGGGLIASVGSVNLQRDLPLQFLDGSYAKAELSGRAFGLGYNLGVQFKLTEKFSLGLNYRSQINKTVDEGTAQFTVPESVAANFPSGTFKSTLPLPQVATLGLAYQFNEKFSAVLDINFVGWKAYDTLAFDYALNTATLEDTKSPRNYRNIFAFRGGVSYQILENLTLRAGSGFGFSPVPSGYVTPETPDANRFYGTFGLSYAMGSRFSLDAALLYTQMKRADTNLETNLSGTFYTKAVAPGISLVYKW